MTKQDQENPYLSQYLPDDNQLGDAALIVVSGKKVARPARLRLQEINCSCRRLLIFNDNILATSS